MPRVNESPAAVPSAGITIAGQPRTAWQRSAVVLSALLPVALFLLFVCAWQGDAAVRHANPNAAALPPDPARDNHYALLARGFLRGHLYLDAVPPPELAQAANPYDAMQRPPVPYIHDASLYRAHYYLYFGPAPAVLLFVPWRVVTGQDLPAAWAVFIAVTLAYAALATFFRAIRQSFFPHASGWAEAAGYLALGSAAMLLPLTRRPSVYEIAISSGSAAALWALYFAWRSRAGPRGVAWAAGCGLLIGLAIASRPTFGAAVIPALILMLGGQTAANAWRWVADRRVGAAAGLGTVAVSALFAYNVARFGRPFEFGQTYQLSAANEAATRHFSPRFVTVQVWFYLLAPLRVTTFFPFIRDVAKLPPPPGFGAHEFSFGILTNLPVTWFAVFSLWGLRRPGGFAGMSTALVAGCLAALAPLLLFFGSCVRYEAEFAPFIALLAACGVLAASLSRVPRAIRWAALPAAVLSFATVTLASIDMYAGDRKEPPRLFDAVGWWLDRPIVSWREGHGAASGAVDLKLKLDGKAQPQVLLADEGTSGRAEVVAVEKVGENKVRVIVRRFGPDPFEHATEIARAGGGVHSLRISLSSLYPIRVTEMPARISREEFRHLKDRVQIDWDGRRVADYVVPPTQWYTERVEVMPQAESARRAAP